jgi:redox-sensitive bicupin YhaK (pirin superfamily)
VEICTYIVEGSLTHKDSMGTAETLTRGAIQFMSAGTGITHSEHNLDSNNPLRFIQIWITTRQRGIKPVYGSAVGTESDRMNKWAHIVQDRQDSNNNCPIKINQDANIFVSEVEPGKVVCIDIKEGRQGYLLCVEGEALVKGATTSIQIARHDAAEITGPNELSLSSQTNEKAHFLLVEMKYEKGSGRSDIY